MSELGFMMAGASIAVFGVLVGSSLRGMDIFEQRLRNLFKDAPPDEGDDPDDEFEDLRDEDYDYETTQRLRGIEALPWEYPDWKIPEEVVPDMTKEEMDFQRRSFAYGNVNMHNPKVTREMVANLADELDRR